MKKTKLLLPALTLSMLGTAIGGGCLVAAAAEPQPRTGPTVGSFVSWDGIGINGTSADAAQNKTVLNTKGGWTRALVPVEGASLDMSIELSLTANEQTAFQFTIFDYPGGSANLATVTATLEANVPYEMTLALNDHASTIGDARDYYLAFYFDTSEAGAEKVVTINSLTVGGVSYTPTEYTPPTGPVEAPSTSFKSYTDWVGTNGTFSANTLEKMTEGDEGYATAVDHGAGNFTITDPSKAAKIEIPLSETLTAWPDAWTNLHVKAKLNNVTQLNFYIESAENCTEEEEEDTHAFCLGVPGGWNATVAKSVSEGYIMANINLGTYLTGFLASEDHASVSKIVIVPVIKEGATEASVEFGGMTFGGKNAPTFINDIGTPELEIGEWLSWGNIPVEANGSLEVEGDKTYKGTKLAYTFANLDSEKSVHTQIANFDATKHTKLHLGFYTDSTITLAIGTDWAPLTQHVEYTKGYHDVEVDFSSITAGSFLLRVWTDMNATEFEGTKNIVIDTVTFYKDGAALAIGDATTNGLFKKPTVTDGKLSWSWDAKDAGAFYAVTVPVDNWHTFDRVLHVNVTLSHETAFGVWGKEAFTDNVLQNSTHPKLAAGTYDMWLSASTAGLTEGGINSVMFYCDVNNASAASLVKTVTINKVEFVSAAEVTSSPNGKNITVNYLEQKVTFEAAYEVATDKDFTNKLASGATVTPGATLYLRAADGSSATTAVTLPSTAISKDSVPKATVGENFIRLSGAGYEFKLGADGTWTAANGSWANLTADTEYTVYVRVKATESAFASEAVELKIKTLAAKTPDEKPDEKPEEKPTDEKKSGCGSIIGLGSLGVAALAAMAVGAAVIVKKKKD